MDWSAVVLALGVAILTGAATLGAVIVQNVLALRDRDAIENDESRSKGAALAPIEINRRWTVNACVTAQRLPRSLMPLTGATEDDPT